MSQPQHYSGPELGALLAQVRTELGQDATIHEANKVRSGGIGGFFAKESFEITASGDELDDHSFDNEVFDNPVAETLLDDQLIDDEPLEPLDVIGDLAHTTPKRRTRRSPATSDQTLAKQTMPNQSPAIQGLPDRLLLDDESDKPLVKINFDRLGPMTIPDRLQTVDRAPTRSPVPTPSPMRSREAASAPSPDVSAGELVADALLQRAELVNALEHLETTDHVIASQMSDADRFSNPALDATFEQVLSATLASPVSEDESFETSLEEDTMQAQDLVDDTDIVEEIDILEELVAEAELVEDEIETVSTADAVSQRIAAQATEEAAEEATQEAAAPELLELPAAIEVGTPPPRHGSANSPVQAAQPIELSIPATDNPVIEPSGSRERPDFWTRLGLAKEEISLYRLPTSNVTAIVGPLDLALPVARATQQKEWIGAEDLAVLSSRATVAGIPSWQMVSRVADLHWAMNEWRASQRRGIVVVDTLDLHTEELHRLISQLRSNGADLVRVTLPIEVDLGAFVEMVSGLGGSIAVDLPAGTTPEDILSMLDRGMLIATIGGLPLTAELLVALRSEVV